MSRPAAPESETLEKTLVERLGEEAALHDRLGEHGWARLCREAATALSLAQTEIKGHMRVEKELRAELKLGPHITGAAPAYTGEGVSMLEVSSAAHVNLRKGRAAIYERALQLERELAIAQARIAELEKDAARYRWLRDVRARKEYRIDGWEGAMWSVEGLHDPHEKGFDAAIDAALKTRA